MGRKGRRGRRKRGRQRWIDKQTGRIANLRSWKVLLYALEHSNFVLGQKSRVVRVHDKRKAAPGVETVLDLILDDRGGEVTRHHRHVRLQRRVLERIYRTSRPENQRDPREREREREREKQLFFLVCLYLYPSHSHR